MVVLCEVTMRGNQTFFSLSHSKAIRLSFTDIFRTVEDKMFWLGIGINFRIFLYLGSILCAHISFLFTHSYS